VSATIIRPFFRALRMARSASSKSRIRTVRKRIKICLKYNTVKSFLFSKHNATRFNKRSSNYKLKLLSAKRTKLIKPRTSANKKS